QVVRLFIEKCPEQLATIREAIEQQDGELLRQTAHSIKGAIGNFTDRAAFEAARHLEQLGRDSDFSLALDGLFRLEQELQELKSALNALVCYFPEQTSSES
ncbi:MAG TPA: Hpt domain-containing protein, partial [Pseudobdellovibrionaceae bacterium]